MKRLSRSIRVKAMKLTDEENRRGKQRAEIQKDVVVTDVLRNLEIGTLANIHCEGFMIIGGREVRENCLYQLAFDLEFEQNKGQKVMLGAECLWLSETGSDEQIWAGFQIIDISEADLNIISMLMEALDR